MPPVENYVKYVATVELISKSEPNHNLNILEKGIEAIFLALIRTNVARSSSLSWRVIFLNISMYVYFCDFHRLLSMTEYGLFCCIQLL